MGSFDTIVKHNFELLRNVRSNPKLYGNAYIFGEFHYAAIVTHINLCNREHGNSTGNQDGTWAHPLTTTAVSNITFLKRE